MYRSLQEYKGNESPLEVDTVFSRKFSEVPPFKYTGLAGGTIKGGINYLDDSTISITLNDFILHDRIPSDNDSITLGYFLEFAYSEIMQLFITFSKPVDVVNLSGFNKSIKNEVGEYECKVNVTDDKTILITSKYAIHKDYISVQDYDRLCEINQKLTELKNSMLILKIHDP
jgi:hypothetical protein